MSQTGDQSTQSRKQSAFNLTLAAVASQVGCLTIIIVFVALFAGLWLDNYFKTRHLFTILFLVGSMPVSLVLMFKVVTAATSRMKPSTSKGNPDLNSEEAERDKD
jgi:F0F1-type ATP synthase assembly protein I